MRKIYSFILLSVLLVSCSLTATENAPTASLPLIGTHTQTPLPIISTPTLLTETSIPTLIPPCLPTPTPYAKSDKSMLGVWRVRHDVEREELHCRSRLWFNGWKKLRGLPETVRIQGGNGTVILSDAWVKFLDRLNTQDAQRFLRKDQNGWLNRGSFPQMEQLTFGGNYVVVTRIVGHKAYIKSFSNAAQPPASGPNTLIQTFSVVYTDGTWEMSTPVGIVYTLIIADSRDGALWIDLEDLIRP